MLQPQFAAVTCIAASGNDVYVGGATGAVDNALYWKNGTDSLGDGSACCNAVGK